MPDSILPLVGARRGHFRMESGYHSSLWLELETLCRRPAVIQPAVDQLADQLRPYHPDAVCGPLNEGAFIAMMVASRLGCEFVYAERFANPADTALFAVAYRVPAAWRVLLRARRVAIVNDVISAGSAVRGSYADLEAHGAHVVAIASLVILGTAIDSFAVEHRLPVEALERAPYEMWLPGDCPLCQSGIPCEAIDG